MIKVGNLYGAIPFAESGILVVLTCNSWLIFRKNTIGYIGGNVNWNPEEMGWELRW